MLRQSDVKEALYKDWVLNNNFVKNYCRDNNLSLEKLSKLKVDYLPDRLVFLQPSNIKPKGNLANDIDTQAKPILGVVIKLESDNISVIACEKTDYTNLVVN